MPNRAAVARAVVFLCGVAATTFAGAVALAERFSASHRHPAIEYATRPRTDRVAELNARLRTGEATLAFDRSRGFLTAVLDALDVPVESQTLVFSKTSLQSDFIGPDNPRAIYFNDDVAVAWIRGAPAIELAALDPQQGVMFYALSQRRRARGFQRPRSCLECHVSDATLGVPGLAVGSAVIDPEGVPYVSIPIDQRTPISSRWGGWYVTGETGLGPHVGNTVATDPDEPMLLEDEANFNLPTVEGRFDTSRLSHALQRHRGADGAGAPDAHDEPARPHRVGVPGDGPRAPRRPRAAESPRGGGRRRDATRNGG